MNRWGVFRSWAMIAALTAWSWTTPVFGQWLTQSVPLNPGWNAVYLATAPSPFLCDTLMAGLPVESVWKWNRAFSTAQFVNDPSELIKPSPDWLVWRAPASGLSFLNTLAGMEANTAYMIHVATNAAPFIWSYKGLVVVPWTRWYPYSINFVGLMVHPTNPPSLAEFFRPTDEVAAGVYSDAQIFSIKPDGTAERIRHTARHTIVPGMAYWIGANNPGNYSGPLDVTPKSGLDFGEELQYLELTIQNLFTNTSLTLTVRPRASETPPADEPELAGAVPLSYYDATVADSNTSAWVELKDAGISHTVAPSQVWTLLLAVRRSDFPLYTPQGANGAVYQSWLEIADSRQTWLARVPVTAEQGLATRRSQRADNDDFVPAAYPAQGLWIGNATLDQVSAPHFTGTNTISTPSPFSFALILHVDGSGQARLLQHVTLALSPVGKTTNYTYILLGGMNPSLPTASPAVNRIASAAFPVMEPLLMAGSSVMTSGTLTATIDLSPNDPMNPFLHLYHPMHDNKDSSGIKYTNALETLAVARAITMQFSSSTNPATEMAHSIWGADFAEGQYQEVISGLQRDPVTVRGEFYLRRISRDEDLN